MICYHVLKWQVPYKGLGEDYFDWRRSGEAYAKRLVRKLERLGHKVALEALPQTAKEAFTRPDFHTRLVNFANYFGLTAFSERRIAVD